LVDEAKVYEAIRRTKRKSVEEQLRRVNPLKEQMNCFLGSDNQLSQFAPALAFGLKKPEFAAGLAGNTGVFFGPPQQVRHY
jgi:hypothetical protein